MTSVQENNLQDHLRHMNEAKKSNNKEAFFHEHNNLKSVLKNIENSDRKTYDKYSKYIDAEF